MWHTRRGVLAGLGLVGLEAVMPPLIKNAGAASLTKAIQGPGFLSSGRKALAHKLLLFKK